MYLYFLVIASNKGSMIHIEPYQNTNLVTVNQRVSGSSPEGRANRERVSDITVWNPFLICIQFAYILSYRHSILQAMPSDTLCSYDGCATLDVF